jgi:di/tricarboxylate transporter
VDDAVRVAGPALRVLRVIRGEEGLAPTTPGLTLEAGDALLVRGEAAALLRLAGGRGAELTPGLRDPAATAQRATSLAELIVRPGSPAIGMSIRELALHARTGALVVGVQRHDDHVRDRVGRLVLRFGDALLVQVDDESLAALHRMPEFLIVEAATTDAGPARRPLAAMLIMAAFVGLSAAGLPRLDVPILAVLAAFAMVAAGCVGARDAYRAIDLRLLVLMAGMIVLGEGLSSSGASSWLAEHLVSVARPLGPVAILSAIYLATNLLTALVSNAAAALVMLPVALETASLAHLSSRPFVMATLFAASIDFSTPIGYQTNTLVYAAGGYRFSDYVKVGAPLNVLWWMLATALIPVFWPLALGG